MISLLELATRESHNRNTPFLLLWPFFHFQPQPHLLTPSHPRVCLARIFPYYEMYSLVGGHNRSRQRAYFQYESNMETDQQLRGWTSSCTNLE